MKQQDIAKRQKDHAFGQNITENVKILWDRGYDIYVATDGSYYVSTEQHRVSEPDAIVQGEFDHTFAVNQALKITA